ncbi:hypothetical protein FX988_04246 [Paraglaciecola mesophila]|uniref:Uncharacterized protein n=1 Tax=Paraglaciecola mesophila TaxID=197222 RepID=A0A857JPE8_9ALTE|nr:hypothetical protein [Paraglaciecola mesophila]QHJ13965.1 hypothetical protein FX988_04246 [Paraglaciecola mesophila]
MKVIVALVVFVAIGATLWFSNQPHNENINAPAAPLPVISRQQILTATDLVEGVKQGLQQDDDQVIDTWMSKAASVAKEADISKDDIDYIESDAARDYVIFQAKRSQFNEAVEQAYYELQGIDAIKAAYPQATDLYASADKLIAERDTLIEQIATELAGGNTPTNAERQAARQQWLKRYNEKQSQ